MIHWGWVLVSAFIGYYLGLATIAALTMLRERQ